MGETRDLIGMTMDEVAATPCVSALPVYRARQLCAWIYGRGETRWEAMTDLPAALRSALASQLRVAWPRVTATSVSSDGTTKYLLSMDDGLSVEAVRLTYRYGPAFCVSTQVGCGMGCVFCASGKTGLARDLDAGEIVGQVLRLRALSGVEAGRAFRVVLMGSGEPLANFEAMRRFLDIMHAPWGLGLSYRHLTVSTCGLVPQIMRLAELGHPVNLSVSLHAADDALRRRMMPGAGRYPVADVVRAADEYARLTGRRVTYEYALFAGVNDSPGQAAELVRLVRGRLAHINVIAGNVVAGTGLRPTMREGVQGFVAVLEAGGVPATIRRELGSDISAACGQLRGKTEAGEGG
jgi:23S rRNA (adenine2503-C2)-methyltransferase